MTSNVKIGIAVAVAAAVVAVIAVRRYRRPSTTGNVAASAERETYYGASGRCFRLSDDSEVPTARCTERGISTGGGAGLGGLADAFGSGFSGVGSSIGGALGSLFGSGASDSSSSDDGGW